MGVIETKEKKYEEELAEDIIKILRDIMGREAVGKRKTSKKMNPMILTDFKKEGKIMTKRALILIFILAWLSTPARAQLEHPDDWYAHGGIMFGCGMFFNAIFSLPGQEGRDLNNESFAVRHPQIMTALICSGVGLVKEFAWDDKADYRDILSNQAGLVLGIGITYQW